MYKPSRVAIVVLKSLNVGEASNVSALIMGQLSLMERDLYDDEPVLDKLNRPHVAIRHSTVLLKAGPGQLDNLAAKLLAENWQTFSCFSTLGQSLNNAFNEYKRLLSTESEVGLVGVGLYGADPAVRRMTKSYSTL